jgi:hypothetical protein
MVVMKSPDSNRGTLQSRMMRGTIANSNRHGMIIHQPDGRTRRSLGDAGQ